MDYLKSRIFCGTPSTQCVVRMLIASYFIALSLGAFPGTDISALLDEFLKPRLSAVLTHGTVFVLSTMILFGIHRRMAALVLAILVFWASYMQLMASPDSDVLGAFWRDLALMGALIMTYAEAPSEDDVRTLEFLRSVQKNASVPEARPTSTTGRFVSRISMPRSRTVEQRKAEEKYRQDLSTVHSG